MARWKTRGCPRCKGTTFIDKDIDGWYEQCMLCSYRIDLKNTLKSLENSSKQEANK